MRPLISLASFKNKKIVLITHAGADVDAIAAAGALSLFLSKKNSVAIGVPEHIALGAKSLAKKAGVNFKINPSLGEADAIILLDFNSWDMLGKMAKAVKECSGEKYLVDHHSKSGDSIVPDKNNWVDSKAVASCSLVYHWFKKSKVEIPLKAATLIACGITADSAHFLVADSETFEIMAEMLARSANRFSKIMELLKVEKDFSQKIAMLKAARRSRVFKIGKFIVATAEVGAFEAGAATALLRVGADIAFAGNSENNELKVSGRAGSLVQSETGLNLARDVFQPLSGFFNGSGGGHPGAAAFNGSNEDPNKALLKCVELCKKKISKKVSGVQLKEYT